MNTDIAAREAHFDINELFYSITTYDSTVVACNETFVRISEYDASEIIGSFHNFIRHEAMPKIVFKTLWDHLFANKPVVAYVKNKTKSGAYYWVLGVVFPVNDQFLSIRIKPGSAIFTTIKELYPLLLKAEETKSLEAVEEILVEHLNALGYRDYDHFMNDVLLTELTERKAALEQFPQSRKILCEENLMGIQGMTQLYEMGRTLRCEYMKWFDNIDSFASVKQIFEEKSHMLRTLAHDIVLLSLNASVASYKLDANGETFGVLASDIRNNAKQNTLLIETIHTAAENLSQSLEKIIFLLSYLSLQMEMVCYFINELRAEEGAALDERTDTLTALVTTYNAQLMEIPALFEAAIIQSVHSLEELEEQIMYLGYVQIYGIIESSRFVDDRLGFKEIFSQLKELIGRTSGEILQMRQTSEQFQQENSKLMQEFKRIEYLIVRFTTNIANTKLEKAA